uniref:Uncharacterized protein n=1 Tax=Medicago truncatula TaxID=3880 RepID=I3SLL6_MEDTR|nr:unknown [Medicago truncatula]
MSTLKFFQLPPLPFLLPSTVLFPNPNSLNLQLPMLSNDCVLQLI